MGMAVFSRFVPVMMLLGLTVPMAIGDARAAGDAAPDPVAINVEPVTENDVRRVSRVGDVVHEDRRIPATVRLVPGGDLKEWCDNGWCHSLTAGEPLVSQGYGPRIFCTTAKSGERDTMFSDYPSYSCVIRDRQTGVPDRIFGLKEFSESLSVNPSRLPTVTRMQVEETPLTEYPEWMTKRRRNFVDGVFRVRYLGLEGSKIVFEIAREPAIPGAMPANVQTIKYDVATKDIIRLPLIDDRENYAEIDTGNVRMDGAYFSGIILSASRVDADSIEYEVRNENKLIELYTNGFWQVGSDGQAIEVQQRYR